MNFLAHIYLSGDNDWVKIGNFMADGIRGKDYLHYSETVQFGILLHRKINSFTDTHPIFRKTRKRLISEFGHFSGVITDIFYDYVLAKHWVAFSDIPLSDYAQDFYNLLTDNFSILSPRAKYILPHMKQGDWLTSYATYQGLQTILYQMDSRTKFVSKMQYALSSLQANEEVIENEFFIFFAEIQQMVSNELKLLG